MKHGGLRLSRRLAIALAVLALCAAGAQAAATSDREPGRAHERPNVVVILTDDQHEASLKVMSRVNRLLAARGATFANTFTNWPVCCPSRATLLTGQYAHNHGVLGNLPPTGGVTAFDDSNTLPLWLQGSGYRTVLIGKYLNGYGEDTDPTYVPPGWDEWYAAAAGTQRVYDYDLNQNGALVHYGTAEADFKQDVFSNLAVDAIERRAPGEPFFLAVNYTAPHNGGPDRNPNPPADCQGGPKPAPRHATAFDTAVVPTPPSFDEADVSDKPAAIRELPRIDQAAFDDIERRYRCRLESLLSVDEGVERIVQALEAAGELDDTLIVFTSDNGFFHGEHRVPIGKNRVYEEAIRVPLVIRGPGVPAGVTVDELAINADLAATIVDATGATPGLALDGHSLLPVAKHPSRTRRRELLIEQKEYAAIRTERYVYVEYTSGERELYDLATDPYQLVSRHLSPAYAAVMAQLADRLAPLRTCAGKSCRANPGSTVMASVQEPPVTKLLQSRNPRYTPPRQSRPGS